MAPLFARAAFVNRLPTVGQCSVVYIWYLLFRNNTAMRNANICIDFFFNQVQQYCLYACVLLLAAVSCIGGLIFSRTL